MYPYIYFIVISKYFFYIIQKGIFLKEKKYKL